MKEGTTKHLALLAVELYEISERFIYELRNKQHESQDVFNYLPQYTINKNKKVGNTPIEARYYHQFVGSLEPHEDGEKYLYFNLNTLDGVLSEEISDSGMDNLFVDLDFEKLLSKFTPEPQENIRGFVIPKTNYLVVELTYITDYDHYSGGYDYDIKIDVVGYLDHNLQRQPFEIPRRTEQTDCTCRIPTPDADKECCTICDNLIYSEEIENNSTKSSQDQAWLVLKTNDGYFIHYKPNSMFYQRLEPSSASESPLTDKEKLIIFLCEKILSNQQKTINLGEEKDEINQKIKYLHQKLMDDYQINSDRDLFKQLKIKKKKNKRKIFAWINYQSQFSYRDGYQQAIEDMNLLIDYK